MKEIDTRKLQAAIAAEAHKNPTVDINTKPGTKVRFAYPGHGWPKDGSDAKRAGLKVDDIYTVESIDVGGFVSYLKLKEVPGRSFNTVLFADAEPRRRNCRRSKSNLP